MKCWQERDSAPRCSTSRCTCTCTASATFINSDNGKSGKRKKTISLYGTFSSQQEQLRARRNFHILLTQHEGPLIFGGALLLPGPPGAGNCCDERGAGGDPLVPARSRSPELHPLFSAAPADALTGLSTPSCNRTRLRD